MNKHTFEGKYGPLLIAEIGGNHEGDFEYAKHLTQLAIDSDVDVVKFQLYTGDSLVNKLESPDRHGHFKKFELTQQQHLSLAQQVKDSGKKYLASVWSEEMLLWIDPYLDFYKIGSGDLNAYSIIKLFADRGKPIILSTGLAHEQEVIDAVDFVRKSNAFYANDNLAVLQCTSMYPINSTDVHLNVMSELQKKTGTIVGYSDHTMGHKALAYAVAMGAKILEFHFTDDPTGKEFRDHKVSLTPKDITELVREIKFINELRGESLKKPLEIETKNDHQISFRRAVYPKKNIDKGSIIAEDDLIALRPFHGIKASDYYKLIGKKAKENISALQVLNWNLFE